MGNKKRTTTPTKATADSDHLVKQLCERAMAALRRGSDIKALRMMKDAAPKFGNSALFHRVHATVSASAAELIDDPSAKRRHVRNAVKSAAKAVAIAPNSLEHANFYALLLFDGAKDGPDYALVIEECDRALALENPNDPAKESILQPESALGSTVEARVAMVQNELKALIQKSNVASISCWMKNFGGLSREKFRMIQVTVEEDDPSEDMSSQNNDSNADVLNEIKKAVKTPEERRKEIEVRVAAARVLQHKSQQVSSGGDKEKGSVVNVSGSVGNASSKAGERRRHGKRIATISDTKDKVKSFWNTMSFEMKMGLLRVKVSEIKAHFSSNMSRKDEGGQAYETLSEALGFGELNQTWKFWVCFRCGERFPDDEPHIDHVVKEHIGKLSPKQESLLPASVDSEWVEMLVNCPWKPLDLTASVRMLEDQSKQEEFEHSGGENDMERGSKVHRFPNSWPLVDDTERAELLEKLSFLFHILARDECLAMTHMNSVIQFTMEELEDLVPGSRILCGDLHQSPRCICFLGASQLKDLVKYLQEVCHSCGVHSSPEKILPDDTSSSPHVSDYEERIVLNDDASCLLVDENLFRCKDGGSESSVGTEKDNSDSLLSWIYAGPTGGEQLAVWLRNIKGKTKRGVELLDNFAKEFGVLQNLCDTKYEQWGYEEALQRVEKHYFEESKKRENVSEFSHCSSYSILRKRRVELVKGERVISLSKRLEVEVISDILKVAGNINVEEFGFDGSSVEVICHVHDLEAGVYDSKSKDWLNQMNTCVEMAIPRQREHITLELSKSDGKILRSMVKMQQLEEKIETVSAFDYRFILLPLVKSFLRVHLEDLVEKDAIEKSDAAREALLAELALDSKEGTTHGNDNSKAKDKKKIKDSRRNVDSKVGSFNDQVETTEEPRVTTCADVQQTGTESYEVEELQSKVDLEADERKLEEALEYQRQVENLAKQILLAERKGDLAASEGVLDEIADPPLEPGVEELLASKNVSADNLDLTERNLLDGDDCSAIADGREKINVEESPFEWRTVRKGKRRSSATVREEGYQAVPSANEEWNQDSVCHVGDGGSWTPRQFQAWEDEEERFQADLKKAVMQSLDTFQACQKSPSNTSEVEKTSQDLEKLGPITGELVGEGASDIDVGAGLLNEAGDYNCFLNVIIQSLWHLRRFREELERSMSEHAHIGVPCVVCALSDILSALSRAYSDAKREPVASSSLRTALSNLYPGNRFFQEGQMNDASEVLAVIYDCLHQSFASGSAVFDYVPVQSNCLTSYNCTDPSCIAHNLFGMTIFEQMICYKCELESRHQEYATFFLIVNANALRTMKAACTDNSFDELLNLVEMSLQLPCDPEAGGCEEINHIHHTISNHPHVFTIAIGWQKTHESAEDIRATLATFATEIDISVLYGSVDSPKSVYRLVSVVCYYGLHYHCFAYNRDTEKWIKYDDKTVKVIGSWLEVLYSCERGRIQPQVLFYEAVD